MKHKEQPKTPPTLDDAVDDLLSGLDDQEASAKRAQINRQKAAEEADARNQENSKKVDEHVTIATEIFETIVAKYKARERFAEIKTTSDARLVANPNWSGGQRFRFAVALQFQRNNSARAEIGFWRVLTNDEKHSHSLVVAIASDAKTNTRQIVGNQLHPASTTNEMIELAIRQSLDLLKTNRY